MSEDNKGKEYTDEGYNLIAICLMWGIATPIRLAQVLGRANARCIESAFNRICKNASAYEDMRDYDIKPPLKGFEKDRLNYYSRIYVKEQTKRKASPEQISRRSGIAIEPIKEYIKELS
jgi:hypothetical protein